MFCPHCGQRQTSNDARFCSACGFPLGVVSELLANGGQLQWRNPAGPEQSTPRSHGIKQGVFLMLSVLVVVPVVIFLGVVLLGLPGELIPLAAIVCVMGGLLRMLYAIFFESNLPANPRGAAAQQYVPPSFQPSYLGTQQQPSALPPQQSAPAPVYNRPQRYNTGELVEPPRASVTDHTTRLLDKQPDEPPRQ